MIVWYKTEKVYILSDTDTDSEITGEENTKKANMVKGFKHMYTYTNSCVSETYLVLVIELAPVWRTILGEELT